MCDDRHRRDGLAMGFALDDASNVGVACAMDGKALMALAGGPTKLAALLGVDRATFYRWKKIPPLRVPEVSRIFGIPRHVLRPDLWEAPADE